MKPVSGETRKCIRDKLYILRNLVERCFNKLKNTRRVATHYGKIAESFIDITSISLRLRHLST